MSFEVITMLGFSVFIAAIIGLFRFRKINKAYYPFLCIVWLGSLAELSSFFVINAGYSNAIIFNIYAIAEGLLLLWFFNQWQLFENNKKVLVALIIASVLFWVGEVFILTDLNTFSSYFNIFHSAITVLLSVSLINKISLWETGALLKNPTIVICFCFIFYFTFSIIVETFWAYGLNKYPVFQKQVFYIFVISNFIINLVYIVAILWMPSKLKFTLQY